MKSYKEQYLENPPTQPKKEKGKKKKRESDHVTLLFRISSDLLCPPEEKPKSPHGPPGLACCGSCPNPTTPNLCPALPLTLGTPTSVLLGAHSHTQQPLDSGSAPHFVSVSASISPP